MESVLLSGSKRPRSEDEETRAAKRILPTPEEECVVILDAGAQYGKVEYSTVLSAGYS